VLCIILKWYSVLYSSSNLSYTQVLLCIILKYYSSRYHFRSIRKSYRARTEPLFPVCHEQIHLAVLGLILSKQEERAMFVMRLAAMLLPCYLVAELSTLLKFLHVVRESVEPKIRANQVSSSLSAYTS